MLTFIQAVYRGVRHWARNALEKASERVLDVQGDDDEAEDADRSPEASDQDKKEE